MAGKVRIFRRGDHWRLGKFVGWWKSFFSDYPEEVKWYCTDGEFKVWCTEREIVEFYSYESAQQKRFVLENPQMAGWEVDSD